MYFLNNRHRTQAQLFDSLCPNAWPRIGDRVNVTRSSLQRPLSLGFFNNYAARHPSYFYYEHGCRDAMARQVMDWRRLRYPVLFGHSINMENRNLRLNLDEAVLRINALFHTPTTPTFKDIFFFTKINNPEESGRASIGLFSVSDSLTYGQIMGISALIRNYLAFLAACALNTPITNVPSARIECTSDVALLCKNPNKFTQIPVSTLLRTITTSALTRISPTSHMQWVGTYMRSLPPISLTALVAELRNCPKSGITYSNNISKYTRINSRSTPNHKELYKAYLREIQRKCRAACKQA